MFEQNTEDDLVDAKYKFLFEDKEYFSRKVIINSQNRFFLNRMSTEKFSLRKFSDQELIKEPKEELMDMHSGSIIISTTKSHLSETSLERIERKLDSFRREVATKDDIINQTNILLENQKRENLELVKKLDILRDMQLSNLANKRLEKYSVLFIVFFAFSLFVNILFDIVIVTTFWNNIGLIFSFGFFLMGKLMGIDWKKK